MSIDLNYHVLWTKALKIVVQASAIQGSLLPPTWLIHENQKSGWGTINEQIPNGFFVTNIIVQVAEPNIMKQ